MMKQARAVGLGVVLATQNPVDLDYKALSNAGLWAIGRLQTPQDRERLLKGLSRPGLDAVVGDLGKRQFVIQDAREDEPVVVQSRHAMCYLRGPMTATEIARLPGAGELPAAEATARPAPATASGHVSAAPAAPVAAAAPRVDDGLLPAPPPVPGDTWFLDPRVAFSERLAPIFGQAAEPVREDGAVSWRPALFADVEMRFDEDRAGFVLDHREQRVWFPLERGGPREPAAAALEEGDLIAEPPPGGRYAILPDWVDEKRELTSLRKRVLDDVYRSETRGMFTHAKLKCHGKAGESREDFERRCRHRIAGRIDEAVGKLKDRYVRDADRIEDRQARKEAKLVELEGIVRARKTEEMVNIGETVFSFFSGRKKSITSAVSRRRQSRTAGDRVERTRGEIEDLREDAVELQERLRGDVAEIQARETALLDDIVEKEVRLEKNDIRLRSFGVLWIPVTRRI
jgi:hypothetical protein